MSIRYQIDLRRGLLRTTVTGVLNSREIEGYFDRLFDDVDFNPAIPGLVDLRQVTGAPVIEELRKIASVVRERRGARAPARRALLVPNDLLFGMMRMFEVYSDGGPFEYATFRDEAEALRWLEHL
jgi:hypothetical protein